MSRRMLRFFLGVLLPLTAATTLFLPNQDIRHAIASSGCVPNRWTTYCVARKMPGKRERFQLLPIFPL
jgi:hypothetical protein